MTRNSDRSPDELCGVKGASRTFERGQFVFRRGDAAGTVYRIETGRLRLERHLADGAAVTLAVLGPGDLVAEAALFSDVYHCDARAEIGSRLLAYPKSEVLAGLEREPEALLKWSRHLASQVRRLRALLELRSIKRADDRVLSYLELQEALGETWNGDRPSSAIAAEIGLTPEALYRTLARLDRQGEIHRRGPKVERKS
ncbi:MAG: Crp/Fnr family transcriptional regulator [Thermoanaerobaculia bacterium]|nr:Crp/Fnr family transcriptional regulator [Thermoanaerobaculia bacterium]